MPRPSYAVLALLLLVAGLGACTSTEAAPQPPHHPAPTGTGSLAGPTAVPWWDRGVLHADGAAFATREREIVHAGGTTVVGHGSFAHGSAWSLVDEGRLRPLVRDPGLVRPVVGPDGRSVVWVAETRREDRPDSTALVDYRVERYDVARHRVTATWRTRSEVFCCDASGALSVLGIDGDGRVVLTDQRTAWSWRPGRPPVELRGPRAGRLSTTVWPGGVMWQESGSAMSSLGGYGTVAADGRIEPVGQVPTDQLGLWSPDGAAYAYPGAADGTVPVKAPLEHVWVQRTDGRRTELRLPALPRSASAGLVAWEAARTVLLEVRRPYAAGVPGGVVGFVRCDVSSGACAATVDEPGPRSRVPGS